MAENAVHPQSVDQDEQQYNHDGPFDFFLGILCRAHELKESIMSETIEFLKIAYWSGIKYFFCMGKT